VKPTFLRPVFYLSQIGAYPSMVGMIWKCNNCNYEVIITDGWEFYRDQYGNRKRFSRPYPISNEGIKKIEGFSGDLFCPKCKIVRDVIIEEFGKTDSHNCPDCGSELKRSLDDTDLCPRCSKGLFKFRDIWTS